MATVNPDGNIQIDIGENGTKTLVTAGKYCDRNIDVNVNVPPVGIIPTGTTTITENGTHDVTNYASAVVNVAGGQATKFTNLFDLTNVTVKTKVEASSSGVTYTADNQCNCIKIPYHHVAGEDVVLRIRGIGTVRDRYGAATLASDGTTMVKNYSFAISSTSYFTMSYDEYGDAMVTFKGNLLTTEWDYFAFNFQYVGVNTNATAVTGPIITINEPIGNGGYVG